MKKIHGSMEMAFSIRIEWKYRRKKNFSWKCFCCFPSRKIRMSKIDVKEGNDLTHQMISSDRIIELQLKYDLQLKIRLPFAETELQLSQSKYTTEATHTDVSSFTSACLNSVYLLLRCLEQSCHIFHIIKMQPNITETPKEIFRLFFRLWKKNSFVNATRVELAPSLSKGTTSTTNFCRLQSHTQSPNARTHNLQYEWDSECKRKKNKKKENGYCNRLGKQRNAMKRLNHSRVEK